MRALGVVSVLLQSVGAILVIGGLFRRDPRAQKRAGGWSVRVRHVLGRLLRRKRRHQTVHLSAHASGSGTASADVLVRPGRRDPDSDVLKRLDWLERATDLIFSELDEERAARKQFHSEIRKQVGDLEERRRSERAELERMIEDARVPERMEWYGAAMLVVGLIGSLIHGLLA